MQYLKRLKADVLMHPYGGAFQAMERRVRAYRRPGILFGFTAKTPLTRATFPLSLTSLICQGLRGKNMKA